MVREKDCWGGWEKGWGVGEGLGEGVGDWGWGKGWVMVCGRVGTCGDLGKTGICFFLFIYFILNFSLNNYFNILLSF